MRQKTNLTILVEKRNEKLEDVFYKEKYEADSDHLKAGFGDATRQKNRTITVISDTIGPKTNRLKNT